MKIDILADEKLLELDQKIKTLEKEELEFSDAKKTTSTGRKQDGIARDKIAVYEAMNERLKTYPDNSVAESYINKNQEHIDILKRIF